MSEGRAVRICRWIACVWGERWRGGREAKDDSSWLTWEMKWPFTEVGKTIWAQNKCSINISYFCIGGFGFLGCLNSVTWGFANAEHSWQSHCRHCAWAWTLPHTIDRIFTQQYHPARIRKPYEKMSICWIFNIFQKLSIFHLILSPLLECKLQERDLTALVYYCTCPEHSGNIS